MKTLIGTCGVRNLEGTIMVEEAMTLENMDKVQVDREGSVAWRYAFHSLPWDKFSLVVTLPTELVEIVEAYEEGDECLYYEQIVASYDSRVDDSLSEEADDELVVFYCNIYYPELFMGFFK